MASELILSDPKRLPDSPNKSIIAQNLWFRQLLFALGRLFLPYAEIEPFFFIYPANCKEAFPMVSFSYKQRGESNAEVNLDSHEKRNRKICFPKPPDYIDF